MEHDVKVVGKFYMRSGAVIEEEVVFDKDKDKDNDKEAVEKIIKNMMYTIKEGFREDYNFQITFGYTMFRGKDISAVTFTVKE